jgi:hypothetical protein
MFDPRSTHLGQQAFFGARNARIALVSRHRLALRHRLAVPQLGRFLRLVKVNLRFGLA